MKPATKRAAPKRKLDVDIAVADIIAAHGLQPVIRAIVTNMEARGMIGSIYTAMRNVIKKMDA